MVVDPVPQKASNGECAGSGVGQGGRWDRLEPAVAGPGLPAVNSGVWGPEAAGGAARGAGRAGLAAGTPASFPVTARPRLP